MMLPGFPEAAPFEGFLGGLLIGGSALVMLLGAGRIAGVSGMLSRATLLNRSGTPWTVAALFVFGIVLGAILFVRTVGPVEAEFPPGWGWLVASGLAVGIGTRLGSGCTSGHGVCGMSRFSKRSIAATLTFIVSGIVRVAILNAYGGAW